MRILISGILVGVVAVVVAAVWRSQSVETQPTASGEAGILTLAVLADDVLIKESNNGDFKKIDREARVGEGAEIKTTSTGRASILYSSGTVANLSENTHAVVKNLNDRGRQSKLRLLAGSIWSKLQNILGKGDLYEIETENMVASVRGTEFRVDFANGISVIEVFENKVEVQAIDPKTGQPIEGGFLMLFAGEKALIDSKNLPSLSRPLKKSKIENPAASVQPIATSSPRPTPRPSPTPTPTLSPVLFLNKPVSNPTPTPASISLPQATPVPKPVITSVTPARLQRSEGSNAEFAINGQYLTGTKTVLLNQFELQFFVLDSFTIFATVGPNIEPGVYDVSVVAISGEKLTLYRAMEIQ